MLEDGGLVANNPAQYAWNESRLVWPNGEADVIVSLGTGLTQSKDLGPDRFLFSLLTRLASFIADTTTVHETVEVRHSVTLIPVLIVPLSPGQGQASGRALLPLESGPWGASSHGRDGRI